MAFTEQFLNIANFKSLQIIVTLIAVWFLIMMVLGRASSVDNSRYYYLRFDAVREQFENLPPENAAVTFFGPSDIALNISPRQIEHEVPGLSVYNFGVIMAGPDTIRALVAEMTNSLLRRQKKVDLAVVRFLPMMYTRRYREVVSTTHFPQFTYRLSFSRLLRDAAWSDLSYLAHVLYLRIVAGGVAQGHWQMLGLLWLRPDLNHSYYSNIWKPETVAPDNVFWAETSRGEIDLYAESRDLEAFISSHRREIYEAGLASHQFLFEPLQLDFDEKFFRDFDLAIDDLKKVAGKVVVFYLPDFYAPGTVSLNPAAQHRLAEKIYRLKKDPRIIYWDYSSFPMTKENFFDIAHMTKAGKKELNRRLAISLRGAGRK
ncbi:MAG: hypothetical protein ACXVBE_00340 [Bdellovibrionota bacterium]